MQHKIDKKFNKGANEYSTCRKVMCKAGKPVTEYKLEKRRKVYNYNIFLPYQIDLKFRRE